MACKQRAPALHVLAYKHTLSITTAYRDETTILLEGYMFSSLLPLHAAQKPFVIAATLDAVLYLSQLLIAAASSLLHDDAAQTHSHGGQQLCFMLASLQSLRSKEESQPQLRPKLKRTSMCRQQCQMAQAIWQSRICL